MMITTLFNACKLLYRSFLLKIRRIDSCHTNDYNTAAATYDDYYSRYLSQSSQELFNRLPLSPGMHVLDLACGTGFFSHRIAHSLGPSGQITAVDLSPGMLARNREGALSKGLAGIRIVEADALAFLETLGDRSVDGVVCGWGICYMKHATLRREIERVVRPGGFVGIIENRACTLKDVSDLFGKALLRHPDAMVKNMAINLPRDHRYLLRTFCKSVFRPVHAWDGDVSVPCENGQEIAEYMLKSGASAGFLDALDRTRVEQVMSTFIQAADRCFGKGRRVPVKHEYCALLATKI